jgi:hypothetical protein
MPSISEIFTGLIMAPYDAAVQAISWIAGKLGFDEVKSILETFSFKDMLVDIAKSLLNVVTMAGDFIIEKFASAKDVIKGVIPDMDAVKEFMKSSLRNVLPVTDENKKWYSINNLVAKAIPNSVYEFAGIDPKTGETIRSEAALNESTGGVSSSEFAAQAVQSNQISVPSEIRNVGMNNQMAIADEEQRLLAAAGPYGVTSPIVSSSNTTNNISSSMTTVVKPFPSATRKPDNISDVLFGIP